MTIVGLFVSARSAVVSTVNQFSAIITLAHTPSPTVWNGTSIHISFRHRQIVAQNQSAKMVCHIVALLAIKFTSICLQMGLVHLPESDSRTTSTFHTNCFHVASDASVTMARLSARICARRYQKSRHSTCHALRHWHFGAICLVRIFWFIFNLPKSKN